MGIDGGEAISDSANCADGNIRQVETLEERLDPKRDHVIEILSDPNPGEELRFESQSVAGDPAAFSLYLPAARGSVPMQKETPLKLFFPVSAPSR
jgi:hypothetical protein